MDFSDIESILKNRWDVDIKRVKKAYKIAEEVHRNQKRKSGEPYIIHPIAVALEMCDINAGEDTICAALLHDTLEDGENPHEIDGEILKEFGPVVHFLIHALSKSPYITDKEEQQEDYFKRLKEAITMDTSIIFIKLADLLHNLNTISSLPQERQKQWADELKFQYYPIFSQYSYRIPPLHQEKYQEMNEKLHKAIEKYDNTSI